MNEPVILLTACVNPNGMNNTILQDSNERLRQYCSALEWYLQNTTNKVIFVENSGCDISSLFDDSISAGRLEVLTFQGNNYDRCFGKGYGEALIIEYALENSKFIHEGGNIIKITGRLICENVKRISKRYTDGDTVYGQIMLNPDGSMETLSQVIVAPALFWESCFVPLKGKINDSTHYWFEHLLFETVQRWTTRGHCFRNMWIPLALRGVSGTSGMTINTTSIKDALIFYVHYILNRLGYYGAIRLSQSKKKDNNKT